MITVNPQFRRNPDLHISYGPQFMFNDDQVLIYDLDITRHTYGSMRNIVIPKSIDIMMSQKWVQRIVIRDIAYGKIFILSYRDYLKYRTIDKQLSGFTLPLSTFAIYPWTEVDLGECCHG